MREKFFISQNKEKWKELEDLLKEKKKDPDKLTRLFIQVTDDLSYARTYYPNRFVRLYLNGIAQQLFYLIYRNRQGRRNKFFYFWKEELPRLIFTSRKVLLFSFCLFILSFGIGALSCANDPEFASVILGENYMEMTMENIRKGDPMAVYKKVNEVDMFLGITFNNLWVSFLVFILGIFYCIGSIGLLMYNGIMIGVFQYFFFKQGLLLTSSLTIWLHGTLEISAMIIASAAGITMGRGLIFPGTHTRFQSFFISARTGLKILLGIMPVIILAAIIESFLTRYTDVPAFIKALLILFSLAFIIIYFVIYPYRKSRDKYLIENESGIPPLRETPFNFMEIHSNGTIFAGMFSFYKKILSSVLKWSLALSVAASAAGYFIIRNYYNYLYSGSTTMLLKIFNYSDYPVFYVINTLLFSVIIFISMKIISEKADPVFKPGKSSFLKTIFFSAFLNSFFFLSGWLSVCLVIVVGPFFMQWLSVSFFERKNILDSIVRSFILLDTALGKAWGLFLVTLVSGILYFFILDTPLFRLYRQIIGWNFSFSENTLAVINIMLNFFIVDFLLLVILPTIIIANFLEYFTLREICESNGLKKRIRTLIKSDS